MLKSLTTSRSRFRCAPVKVWPPPLLVLPSPTAFWKNQKPFWASPALSNRSIPKNSTLHVELLDGQVAGLEGKLYRAANPLSRMSLPGKPPDAWFQAQLETSMGSLEPPPVNVVPVEAPCDANSIAEAPFVLVVVEQSVPRTWWHTRSQSSGAP